MNFRRFRLISYVICFFVLTCNRNLKANQMAQHMLGSAYVTMILSASFDSVTRKAAFAPICMPIAAAILIHAIYKSQPDGQMPEVVGTLIGGMIGAILGAQYR